MSAQAAQAPALQAVSGRVGPGAPEGWQKHAGSTTSCPIRSD
eukprot:CAMPEP_0206430842 /NCGR_PEP_ID=MMETSP0324_2-20121206/7038_1 /ASSEMBLY_ACC=CAM_ASM_000836 /TAXON_ID=2866 /ORGANISM="Crypthecodinium cohnii, Strain Seligo" /LENGTH=41 /DNA_ID= /DNA_START= /DNA_END= /DNA_ORIENTATION=